MKEVIDPNRAKDIIRKNAEQSNWPYAPHAKFLNDLAVKLRDEVIDPLAVVGRDRMPDPIIGFDDARNKEVLAYYNTVQDAYGLPDTVVFNTAHYEDKEGKKEYKYSLWTQAEILAHEMTHLYFNYLKEIDGKKRPAHGKEFIEKCESMGLKCNRDGAHYEVAAEESSFGRLMKKLGIERPTDVPRADPKGDYFRPKREKGRSTLTKWSCGCQNVRVGTKDFNTQCTNPECGHVFVKIDGQEHTVYKAR